MKVFFSLKFYWTKLKNMDFNITKFQICKKDFYSRHNLGYWNNQKYLGVGPSAHSFDGITRCWNTKLHHVYIEGVNSGQKYYEVERLNTSEKFNDYVLTRLRTMWGLDYKYIAQNFGEAYVKEVSRISEKYNNYLIMENDCITLNTKGKFIADRIASEFFIVDVN
ncbi:MAG: hypothetical protein HC905_16285 [Bacteroidales bacterium]|nr:hypothetical protein [Bacteroidales bacterium]